MIRTALLIAAVALPARAANTESEYRDMLCGAEVTKIEDCQLRNYGGAE
jgi:hypothetical protein